jgi:hypothetical protein
MTEEFVVIGVRVLLRRRSQRGRIVVVVGRGEEGGTARVWHGWRARQPRREDIEA